MIGSVSAVPVRRLCFSLTGRGASCIAAFVAGDTLNALKIRFWEHPVLPEFPPLSQWAHQEEEPKAMRGFGARSSRVRHPAARKKNRLVKRFPLSEPASRSVKLATVSLANRVEPQGKNRHGLEGMSLGDDSCAQGRGSLGCLQKSCPHSHNNWKNFTAHYFAGLFSRNSRCFAGFCPASARRSL